MKVIVIGATGTIGAAVAAALEERHQIVRASRTGDVKVDLEDTPTLRALFESEKNVDAVVSCGGAAAFRPLTSLTDDDFRLSLRSKLMGQVNLARVALEHLRDGGSVTLTSGVLARYPMVGGAAVSLVNSGIEGFARSAALEMPRGLRINVISPGWVKETLVKLGMDPTPGIAAADLAKAYVQMVEGTASGEVLDVTGARPAPAS